MKLKNKKTGEIGTLSSSAGSTYTILDGNGVALGNYRYLKDLCLEWHDYEEPKEYWFINEIGKVEKAPSDWLCNERDCRQEIGNYFETKEEAEKAVEKLKAWKRLRDKGLEVTEWSHGLCLDKTIVGRFRYEFPIDNKDDVEKDLDLLFGGGE